MVVVYIVLGYLIGFSIAVYWHFSKIKDYFKIITNKLDRLDREYRYNNSLSDIIFKTVQHLHTDLEDKGVIISDEWEVSPEEAEKMYNAAQVIIREYHRKK